ncbi:uncharacterized protein CC84DRAFT_1168911 [Paraphaeosphaeria sporulosa]|uniref:Uncharacterized protein n=1 Tax=Paraphaeosphaeria sporulosa TaxID=1460663 RepID=A0A177BWY6_9PLEO|nr:uncharacterized protein CC84DRAFT_1168911 [Paraphaeosphaeria sporulosa]OAG00014.1 hypothetical protein CC84DRAFT_1168911 [Paraphaeosphaeria sporulosa]
MDSSFPTVIEIAAPRHFGAEEESANGFVGTILDAYRMHNHVVLRPEDVWLGILMQFNFYVNEHAEQLREHFVDHQGKRKLEIVHELMDLPAFLIEMTNLVDKNIKDPSLRDWIMPNFTTTTDTDKLAASVTMMGTLQKYFVYEYGITCGIPSVTLLGEENDWRDIHNRLDYLSTFARDHPELAMWQSSLKVLVSKMVETFKAPDSPSVVRFWQGAVHSSRDSYLGAKLLSGWILAFIFWGTDGKLLGGQGPARRWAKMVAENGNDWWYGEKTYYPVEWHDVPAALVHVPIHIRDGKEKYMAKAVAGSVGYTVRDSEEVFQSTRQRGKRNSNLSGDTMAASPCDGSVREQGLLRKLTQKLLCFWPSAQSVPSRAEEQKATYPTIPERKTTAQWDYEYGGTLEVPQFSDLSELNEPWANEQGGKRDTLQPVTGWWVIRTSEGQFGRDADVPDVQFDRDAPDYDKDLAEKGRPLRERGEL